MSVPALLTTAVLALRRKAPPPPPPEPEPSGAVFNTLVAIAIFWVLPCVLFALSDKKCAAPKIDITLSSGAALLSGIDVTLSSGAALLSGTDITR